MGKNLSNGHAELTPQGTPKLTAKEERFAQLIALEGFNQSAAYRQAYDCSPDSKPSTIHENASHLATKVAPRIAELRDAIQSQSIATRERIIEELAKVAFAERQEGPVRDADKTAALDKIAKVSGLYREVPKDPNVHPINIREVVVILSHGKTETFPVEDHRPQNVVEGESAVLPPEDGADSPS